MGIRAIVCCAGDCSVAMGKLRTSGGFVFCWARSQAAVTYYSPAREPEHTEQCPMWPLEGQDGPHHRKIEGWVFAQCFTLTWGDKQTQHFGSLWVWSFNFGGRPSQFLMLTPSKKQNKNVSALHIKIPCKGWHALK